MTRPSQTVAVGRMRWWWPGAACAVAVRPIEDQPAIIEHVAQVAARIVQRRVERHARRVQALREDVDRNAVDRQRNQNAALMAGQVRADAVRQRLEDFNVFARGVGALRRFGELLPALGVQDHLAAMPRPPARSGARFEDRELARPGRKAAVAAGVVELGQHGEERMICRLRRELVQAASST